MYESRKTPPLPRIHFVRRLALHSAISLLIVLGSLIMGMVGYAYLEEMSCVDAFLNASMILGGMGPVATPKTDRGKVFAGFYALYSGIVFLIAAGFVVAPVMHRILHKFHWDDES